RAVARSPRSGVEPGLGEDGGLREFVVADDGWMAEVASSSVASERLGVGLVDAAEAAEFALERVVVAVVVGVVGGELCFGNGVIGDDLFDDPNGHGELGGPWLS